MYLLRKRHVLRFKLSITVESIDRIWLSRSFQIVGAWTEKDLCWADVKYDRTGVFNLNLFIFVVVNSYVGKLVSWRDSLVCYGE